MIFFRRNFVFIIEVLFLIFIFFASQLPLRDFDIWFHIKTGELILNLQAIPRTESFSYSAAGREWTTFEWLFQVIIYLISQIGLWAIPPFISFFIVIEYFFFLRILGYIFRLSLLPRLLLAFGFWVSTYEFNTARPHTIAYAFLTMVIFLILARIFKGKKWIYATPLVTLVWQNIHSTGFLSWGFHLIFASILLLQWFLTRKRDLLPIIKDLIFLTIINFIITLTPPMGILDYKLLWRFFLEREFLAYFIAEWGPPQDNPFGFRIYTASVITSLVLFTLISIKNKSLVKNLLGIPFIITAAAGYSATRNIYLGTLGLFILFGWSLTYLINWLKPNLKIIFYIILSIIILGFYLWVFSLKYDNIHANRLYYPVGATEFIKTHDLLGNMFNDYNYGAYMLYQLYPQKKVFIDGRADVFLCCEMHDYLQLAGKKKLPDDKYRQFLKDTIWDKYHISYAVIVTTKHNVMRRIATLLNTDPEWILGYWDDDAQIFIRRDGKNANVIKQFGASVATPYLRSPYIGGKEKEALIEYEKMDRIEKSAHTSNAIGYLLLKQQRFDEAKARFVEAVKLDPTFESPYMNLAELAVKDGNLKEAIDLYFKAYQLAPDRGLIYIRLGQLTLEYTKDSAKARKIWQDGLQNTVDDEAKAKLKQLISNL